MYHRMLLYRARVYKKGQRRIGEGGADFCSSKFEPPPLSSLLGCWPLYSWVLASSLLLSSQCPCSRLALLLLLRCPVLYTLNPTLLYSPQSMAPSLFCPYPHTLGRLLSFRISTVVPKTNGVICVPAPHLNQSLFPVPSLFLISLSGYPTRQPLSGPLCPSFWLPFFLSNVHLRLTQTLAG
jgi:hypothetical protein